MLIIRLAPRLLAELRHEAAKEKERTLSAITRILIGEALEARRKRK